MSKVKWGIAGLAIVASAALSAKADLIFNLDQVYASGGFGLPAGTVYGTVDLAQGAANTVNVTVNLNSGFTFVGGGAGYALGFDLNGGSSVGTITVITPPASAWQAVYSPPLLHADGTGLWQYAVDYTGSGASGNPPSSLTFSVAATGTLTPADFVTNPSNLYFVSDIFANGFTGDVAANAVSNPVPEPTTMIAGALLLLPFGASTLRIVRKNRMA